MKITRQPQDTSANKWKDWHILTVGEAGFSMLDVYGRVQRGLNIDVLRRFADRINQNDESGTLHPQAPISAVPCRFFSELSDATGPEILNDFKRHIGEFVDANQRTIKASRVLVDFHVSSAPVPLLYIEATEEIFRRTMQESLAREVVIFT